mgnify:CR=1 FL=1
MKRRWWLLGLAAALLLAVLSPLASALVMFGGGLYLTSKA